MEIGRTKSPVVSIINRNHKNDPIFFCVYLRISIMLSSAWNKKKRKNIGNCLIVEIRIPIPTQEKSV